MCGVASCFALNQHLASFHISLVIVLFMYGRKANHPVHLLAPVPTVADFAVFSACLLPSTPTCLRTQWTSISTTLLASLSALATITRASHFPGPGAVCLRHAIAVYESFQMYTFIYGRAASWEVLSLVACPPLEATSSASATT